MNSLKTTYIFEPSLSQYNCSSKNDISESDMSTPQRQIVLCFDGTGNTFRTDGADTNILKICGQGYAS
jgi:uncharacterized protein (DUF2235 family)